MSTDTTSPLRVFILHTGERWCISDAIFQRFGQDPNEPTIRLVVPFPGEPTEPRTFDRQEDGTYRERVAEA